MARNRHARGAASGLKPSLRRRIERLGTKRTAPGVIISPDLARDLAAVSFEAGRQLGLLIDRRGRVATVVVGDREGIVIPVLPQTRVAGARLKGLRCVHTHLDPSGLSRDDLMDLACLRLDLMAALCVDRQGYPALLHAAHLVPGGPGGEPWQILPPAHPAHLEADFLARIDAIEEEFARTGRDARRVTAADRAILVSVSTAPKAVAERSLDELAELARTAGVEVVGRAAQRRRKVNPRLLMGRGKVGELMLMALERDANILIFDQELNPSQVRSITDHTDMRVIDRTQLILDIFAARAKSREGKLQVEMAQLRYLMPRLAARDDSLSRLTGGIGARGPGETRLEIDRRRIKDRMAMLSARLRQVSRQRHERRRRRAARRVPQVSLVGYTNAGKSTLLNALTGSAVTAEDRLFATLDPTSRRLRVPHDIEVIISDTVGFISRLPGDLVQAFAATLEELHEADLLLHVIDGANPEAQEQKAAVERILASLGLGGIPVLPVLNKVDAVGQERARDLAGRFGAVPVSALNGDGLVELSGRIGAMLVHLSPALARRAADTVD